MKYNKKSIFVVLILGGLILFLSKCINQVEAGNDPRGKLYAGAATCRQCHQAIYDSFLNTAHFEATSPAIQKNIRGDFGKGNNVYHYDSTTKIVMEKRDDGYYQVLYENGKEKKAYKLDILFGYRNAQTSLYWSNGHFYELPLSHYTSVNAWATSPGFSGSQTNFGRIVNTECFDCHTSGINIKPGAVPMGAEQLLDKETLVYGIDCERCHGPALNHVNYHLENPGAKAAAFLVKNGGLTRGQKLDACAICHSGNDKMKIQSRFLFKMGDTLGYFFMPFAGKKTAFDVHGNQFSLLQQSKCFRGGSTMTCGTCHDPHKNASNDLRIYSQKCMSCHKEETNNFCPEFASLGESIKANCIDCHMPRQASKAISFQMEGSEIQSAYLLRTHKIAVYRDSIQTVHSNIKGIKN